MLESFHGMSFLELSTTYFIQQGFLNFSGSAFSLVRDLKIILIFHPHYHTHSGNTSRPVNLAVVRWLVSNEDENEYGYDNGNEIAD